jgi:Zn-finger nucleic acid-binding protein
VDCPRCTPAPSHDSPYRDGPAEHLRRPPLSTEKHPSGLTIDRCTTCGGVWLDPGEMEQAERIARERGKGRKDEGVVIADLYRRTYDNARRAQQERPPIDCPACGDPMFEREWIYGSALRVEVCMSCRGVWLDEGELDDLARFLGASWD